MVNRRLLAVLIGGLIACSTSSQTDTSSPKNKDKSTECLTGPCDAEVVDAKLVDCESDSGTMTTLKASVAGNGEIDVEHYAVQVGCCPTFSASATYDASEALIEVDYVFAEDMCDCICMLDVSYTISGVPAGEWTLRTVNGETAVRIE